VFTEAKDDGGGGDNWTTGAISRAKLQSNHHHQQTNIQNSRKEILGLIDRTERSSSMDLLIPRRSPKQCTPTTHRSTALGGLPSRSLTTKGSWTHLAKPLVSSLVSDTIIQQ